MQTLKDKLRKRLSSDADVDIVIQIVEKYHLKFNIRNFDSHGILFRDENGRTVRVLNGVIRNGFIHTKYSHADIVIIFVDDLLIGWVESDKMDDLDDRMSIHVKSVHVMPETFVFKQLCPHLDVYGGFYEGENWECAGCGERLVFSDN